VSGEARAASVGSCLLAAVRNGVCSLLACDTRAKSWPQGDRCCKCKGARADEGSTNKDVDSGLIVFGFGQFALLVVSVSDEEWMGGKKGEK
jgi:hypothetical protein